MTVGSQMPELDRGFFCPPPLKIQIGSQNTPYKLRLSSPAALRQISEIWQSKFSLLLIATTSKSTLSLE